MLVERNGVAEILGYVLVSNMDTEQAQFSSERLADDWVLDQFGGSGLKKRHQALELSVNRIAFPGEYERLSFRGWTGQRDRTGTRGCQYHPISSQDTTPSGVGRAAASADLGYPQAAAYLLGEKVRELRMPWYGLNCAGPRVEPKGVRPTFPLKDAAVKSEVSEKSAALQVETALRRAAYIDGDGLTLGVSRNATETILTAILKDQCDCLGKVVARLVLGRALAVGPRHFRAVRYVQFTIAFEHGGELVAHDASTCDGTARRSGRRGFNKIAGSIGTVYDAPPTLRTRSSALSDQSRSWVV
jgi:hypothetical protein